MRKFILFTLLCINYPCLGQGNLISISSTVPVQITVCGTPKVFTISIYNPSPFTVTNDTLKLTLPTGIIYQTGSVTGAGVSEFNITVPNKPVFLLPPIPSLAPSLTITFTAAANCDLIAFIAGGGTVENTTQVNYTANNIANYDTHTSLTYVVKQPALNITNVTNQTYSGSVGNTYTRCITITNSGLGELSQFIFTDDHGNGITVSNINGGNWANSGITETVTFSSSHFNTIGNNNGLFEQGESITFCETIQIISCVGVASNFTAYWGCNNQVCQSTTLGANVIFPNLIPDIEIIPINPPMNPCLGPGNASIQKLMVINTGLGQATNIHLDIFQTNNGLGYNNNVASYIDESSFTIQTNSSIPVTIVPDSTKTTSQLGCMPVNAIGRVFLTITSLIAGDTMYLTWNTYSCCYNACTSVGQSYFNGWAYQGSYKNVCQNDYLINTAWGRVHSQLYASLINNASPSVLDSGEAGTFNFKFSSYGFQQPYPGDSTGYWKFIFTLPACLDSSGNPSIMSSNGIDTWNPQSVTMSGNTLTAIFSGTTPPFDLNLAQVKLNLAVDCNGCSGGFGTVDIKAIYVPSVSCSCQVTVSCTNAPITILCSTPVITTPEPAISTCPEGMMFRYYSFKRASYGLPDNEAGGGNGLPDNTGILDFSKIKTNRAMFGDTITSAFHGKVRTSMAYPSWQYCYASASITNGNLFGFLSAQALIYRNGILIATCNSLVPVVTNTGTTRKFSYDLSTPGLISSGCLPVGFTYLNNDSVVLFHSYKIIVNTTGPIQTCESTNEFYVSNIMNPSSPSDKHFCDGFYGICFVMGYRFEMHDDTYYTIQSCQNAVITQDYFLSIGPCCSNYEGGNLFPYEYRNWAHINTLTATIPSGYKFISAQFIERRTTGSGASNTSLPIPLIPVNPDSSTLVFSVEHYFQSYGGTLPLSDDGFSGTLEVTIAPSCEVTPVISQGIKYDWTFTPTNYLTGAGSYPTLLTATPDYIIYNAPSVFLQCVLPSINVPDSIAVWDITLSNPSNASNAENIWLSSPQISGIAVVELMDVDNNIIIPVAGSIYQLGLVFAATERHFKIKALFTSCAQDSIILYSGWNCTDGYPTDVSSYPCIPEKVVLMETPLIPAIDMLMTVPANSVQLCDTNTYVIEGFNFQAGTLYNVVFTTILPLGTSIVPGSSELLYPNDSIYASISDPVLVTGTTWQWNLSVINSFIGNNGLKGFADSTLNSFKIKFKLVTDCNYTSGSRIRFNLIGNASCGLTVNQDAVSEPLLITGATPVYTTNISMSTTYLSPCAANSTMHITVVNTGNVAFGTTDSVAIILPPGVNYETGSFTAIHNAPLNNSPALFIINNQTTLKWNMPAGVQPGDSVVFNLNYAGTPAELSCGISYFLANTLIVANVLCTSSNNSCNIQVITGYDTLPVFTYKAYLSLSNGTGLSVPNPPGGENATINFTINNTGQDVFATHNTIISYYYDSNGNENLDLNDVFITYDTLNALIPGNGNYSYTSTIFLPSGNTCTVIAVIDTSVYYCSCVSTQIAIDVPLYNANSDTIVCSNQIITLGAAPVNGYTYSWSPSTGLNNVNSSSPDYTAPSVSNTPDTAYFEVTTDRIGCISKDTITVITVPDPTISITGTDTICFGESSGSLIASVSGNGTPQYDYLWSTTPSQLNDTATGLTAGTYSVTVTDANGCIANQSYTINQTATALTVSITNQTNLICNSICDGSATAIASGGASGYTFLWNTTPIQTSATATNLCANSYFVVVTDAYGCSATDSSTIIEPTPIVTTTSIVNGNCNNNNNAIAIVAVNGGTAGYSFLWSNGQTTDTIVSLSSGIYIVTITDANNCTQTDSAIITPALNVNANAASTSVCEGQNTTIDALISGGTPNYIFLWNNAQTTQSITVQPDSTTAYTIIVTDINGCIDSATVSITVRSSPIVDFQSDSIGCSPLCINFQNLSIIAIGTNQQWLWNFGDGSSSNLENPTHCFTNNSVVSPINNTISLTVTSNEGCSTTLTKNNYITINPTPIAEFDYVPNPPTILNPIVSFQNQSLGANGWLWHFSDGLQDTSSILQHPYYTYIDTGTFAVELIAANSYSCFDTVRKDIIVGQDWAIYIPNAFTPNGDNINETFIVKTFGIEEFEMLIFDRWGNLIFRTDNINKPWDGKANQGTEVAQQDIYVYTIKAKDIFGHVHKFRGTVTLVD